MFVVCGIWLVGLGVYFAAFRPPLLPEDPRYIGSTLAEIQAAIPGLARWLRRVFTVLGGFMTAAGALTIFVAIKAAAARTSGTGWLLALAGALTVVLMSATNFALESDFKWGLLVPAALWLAAVACYALKR